MWVTHRRNALQTDVFTPKHTLDIYSKNACYFTSEKLYDFRNYTVHSIANETEKSDAHNQLFNLSLRCADRHAS